MDKEIDLTAVLEERYQNLLKKKGSNTWTDWDFIGVWDIYVLCILDKIKYYINQLNITGSGLSIDEAVFAGHIARIFDLLRSERRIVLEKAVTRVTMSIINRSIIETCVTLEYLLIEDKTALLNDYRMDSLRMLSAYEDIVKRNIQLRGSELPIETSIMKSITQVYVNSQLSRTDIDNWSKRQSSLKSFKSRFNVVYNTDTTYDVIYKSSSQEAHGNWDSILRNYLKYDKKTKTYTVCSNASSIDFRDVNPSFIIIVKAMRHFINSKRYIVLANIISETQELDNILKDMYKLEELHEVFLGR